MGDWREGDPDRRHGSEQEKRERMEVMKLLTNMDKNLALAIQRQETQGKTLDAHIIDDKSVQDELKEEQIKINNRIAHWIGGGAVIMAIAMPVLNRVLETVWK